MTLKVKDAAGDIVHLAGSGAGTELDPFVASHSSPETIVNELNFVNEYLKSAGASNSLAVDGATTPTLFFYKPPTGKKLVGGRLMLYMEGLAGFDSIKFGDRVVLPNGCLVQINGVTIDTWKDNIDMVTTFHDAPALPQFAKETKSISGRWTFSKAAGGFDGLAILETSGIAIRVQDALNHAGFVFRAKIQGRLEDV